MIKKLKLLMHTCIVLGLIFMTASAAKMSSLEESLRAAVKKGQSVDRVLSSARGASKAQKDTAISNILGDADFTAKYASKKELKRLEALGVPPLAGDVVAKIKEIQGKFKRAVEDELSEAKRKGRTYIVGKNTIDMRKINQELHNSTKWGDFYLFDVNGNPFDKTMKKDNGTALTPKDLEGKDIKTDLDAFNTDAVKLLAADALKDAKEAAKVIRARDPKKAAEDLHAKLVKYKTDAEEIAGIDGKGGKVKKHFDDNYAAAEQTKKDAFNVAVADYQAKYTAYGDVPDLPVVIGGKKSVGKKLYEQYVSGNQAKNRDGQALVESAKAVLAAVNALAGGAGDGDAPAGAFDAKVDKLTAPQVTALKAIEITKKSKQKLISDDGFFSNLIEGQTFEEAFGDAKVCKTGSTAAAKKNAAQMQARVTQAKNGVDSAGFSNEQAAYIKSRIDASINVMP